MAQTTYRQPRDLTRINVHEHWDVHYWARHFGVTDTQLRQAVQSVGPLVPEVRQCVRDLQAGDSGPARMQMG